MEATFQCPRCAGKVTARSDTTTGAEIFHTLPPCASFEVINSIEDATALIAEARENRQRELGFPVTVFGGDA